MMISTCHARFVITDLHVEPTFWSIRLFKKKCQEAPCMDNQWKGKDSLNSSGYCICLRCELVNKNSSCCLLLTIWRRNCVHLPLLQNKYWNVLQFVSSPNWHKYPRQLTDEGDRYKVRADRHQDHSCLSYYNVNTRDWIFKWVVKESIVTNTCHDKHYYLLCTIRGTKYSIVPKQAGTLHQLKNALI